MNINFCIIEQTLTWSRW